jgi:predicted aspartyl protease
MTISFDPRQGLIIIPVELFGPSGSFVLRFALDTGASYTVVSVGMLQSIGYDPSAAKTRIPITTGSGQESAPKVVIVGNASRNGNRIDALTQTRLLFPVLAHTVPASVGIDGLLGLDFLRRQTLNIDFRAGKINLIKSPL